MKVRPTIPDLFHMISAALFVLDIVAYLFGLVWVIGKGSDGYDSFQDWRQKKADERIRRSLGI